MSPSHARIRDHVVNALITALATLFLTFGTGVWHSKENVTAHDADINAILDVLCEIKPQARACTRLGRSPGEIAQR